MINVTTQQGAEGVLRTDSRPAHRISSRGLVVLMGAELILLFGVLVWALFWLLPAGTPFASQNDMTPVVEVVRGSLSGAINDPLIDVRPGVSARASNLRGLSMGGSVYYYYVEGHANFDPLSRGAIRSDSVEVMLRDSSGPSEIVIYRLR
ncbi:MAG: hypothetical protein WCI67_02525 [Chloroflexales bacterium]